MKHDFLKTQHPVTALGNALWNWTWSTRGMPLKVSALGAVLCLAASFGVSASLGKEFTETDALLKEEQMKACRIANPGLSNHEMTIRNLKCLSVHPGIFGP
jgi:hypothetical protein